MISISSSFRRAAVLAFILFIIAALAASAAVSIQVTTQRYTPDIPIATDDNVHDEAYVKGSSDGGAIDPTGTVQFYVCFSPGATGTDYPRCDATTDGTLWGVPVAVGSFNRNGNDSTGTVVSSDYTRSNAGTYCFLAVYTPDENSPYPMTTAGASLNAHAACGAIVDPTAVTLSSMSAQSVDGGMGWAKVGLGALGIVMLGGVLFVTARKP